MSRDIEAGALVRILPDWILDSDGGVYVVRPSAKFTPAKTAVFVKWISAKFAPAALGVAWPSHNQAPAATIFLGRQPRLVGGLLQMVQR
jgi:hypothetical protein